MYTLTHKNDIHDMHTTNKYILCLFELAVRYNRLQHTAPHCNKPPHTSDKPAVRGRRI